MMQDFSLGHLELREREVAIRSANADDKRLLTRWFNNPAVYAYWGGKPLSDDEITEHCTVQVTDDTCWPFIITQNEHPVGFIQAWVRNDMTGGLDLVIAPHHRRKGIGPRALRMLADYLCETAGWKRVTVDPCVDNTAAIAAFERAGFRDTGERFIEDNDLHMVMAFQ
jgi:aminoglycoside 6'-N-acetyltransferase